MLVECVVNISEGRDLATVRAIAAEAGGTLLDVHSDADHHRSVLTLGGDVADVEQAARAVVGAAVAAIDLAGHQGVHPRLGAADVVPFVPLDPDDGLDTALSLRARFAAWAGATLAVPCFLYGPERPLPEVRREAFRTLTPDTGPPSPHPTAGATAVGARPPLVAYNIWISMQEGGTADTGGAVELARSVAAAIRSPAVLSLGLPMEAGAQVSCNLVDPLATDLAALVDAVDHLVDEAGGRVDRLELVGLLPAAMLRTVPPRRWSELSVSEGQTVEARLAAPVG